MRQLQTQNWFNARRQSGQGSKKHILQVIAEWLGLSWCWCWNWGLRVRAGAKVGHPVPWLRDFIPVTVWFKIDFSYFVAISTTSLSKVCHLSHECTKFTCSFCLIFYFYLYLLYPIQANIAFFYCISLQLLCVPLFIYYFNTNSIMHIFHMFIPRYK